MNFNWFPSNTGEQLIVKLVDEDSMTSIVLDVIKHHGNMLVEEIKKEILGKVKSIQIKGIARGNNDANDKLHCALRSLDFP